MIVNSSKAVSLAEVKEILKKREGSEELGYEQKQTVEYLDKFADSEKKDADKWMAELMKNERVTLETAVKIVDLKPKRIETLKAILTKDKVDLTEEEMSTVLKTIS
ncbi:hypothetical protein HYT84_02770 [Candidatus Micrarchaeota archaeon]|nr:hypothetical protein [Candidatus Micrarchaeota archaeon]